MLILLGFAFVILFGFFISSLIAKDLHLFEKLGLSFLLGLGIFTFLMFVFSWAGLPISLTDYSLILIVGIGLLLVIQRKTVKKTIVSTLKNIKMSKINLLDKILIVGIVSLVGYSLFTSLYTPVIDWDSLVLYDFRAKVFLNAKYLVDVLHSWGYFWGYPLLTSLAHLWVYLLGGNSPVFIYSLFYLSLLLIFYDSVRRYSSRTISLVATLLLASTPLIFYQSMIAYTNVPYTAYIVSGTIYIFLWAKMGKREYLILGALLTGLSTWTRSVEPFWLTNLLFVLAHSLYKKRYSALVLYPAVFLTIQFPWRIFQKILIHVPYVTDQIKGSVSTLMGKFSIGRAGLVLSYLYSSVFTSWGLSAILFVIIVFVNVFCRQWKWNFEFLILIFANLLLLFLGTYVFSFGVNSWLLIPDSARRMSMFFIPLFYFYIFSSKAIQEYF